MTTNQINDSQIEITGPAGQLETSLTRGDEQGVLAQSDYVVVVCHPHPQHGGSMSNKVVTTLMRCYRDLGVAVVRFNFRGVGESQGSFNQGVGEKDDLRAVIAWVQQYFPTGKLLLAGFSFGSAIAAQVSYESVDPHHLLLVAPPLERYGYDKGGRFVCPLAVVQGDKDERVLAEGVYRWVEGLQSSVDLVRYPDAGHFFHGYLVDLKQDVSRILSSRLSL